MPRANKARSKWLLLLLGGVALGAAALGGCYLAFFRAQPAAAAPVSAPAAAHDGEESPAKNQVVTLKPIVVNLRNSKATRFLKVTLSFQTNAKKAVDDLTRLSPELADFLVARRA